MPYSLIIDTSHKYLVIGLAKEKLIDSIQYEAWQRQSEFALFEIDKILKRNQIIPSDISKIFVTIGPGSYTGIRIGLTIAKVWSITNNIKVYPLSSLQAMTNVNSKQIAILDARSDRFYVGMYNLGQKLFNDKILTKEELLELIKSNLDYEVVGDIDLIDLDKKPIDFANNIVLLQDKIKPCENIDAITPLYLKEAL